MSKTTTSGRRAAAGALVALLLPTLAACGGSDDDTPSSSSGSTASYPKIDAAPATGTSVSGNGYSYKLPSGWQDITSQLKATQPSIDSGGRATPPTDPFTTNLNVLSAANSVQKTQPTVTDLKQVSAQIKAEILPLAPKVKQLSPVEVDGSPTLRQEGAASNDGSNFYLVQYWVVTPGNSYGFTFAFPTSTGASARTKVTDSVLASFKLTK